MTVKYTMGTHLYHSIKHSQYWARCFLSLFGMVHFSTMYNKLTSSSQLYHRDDKLLLYNNSLLVYAQAFHNSSTLLLILLNWFLLCQFVVFVTTNVCLPLMYYC